MAYGLHWEWRGFGALGENIQARIERLRPLRQAPVRLTDRYLWFPGCDVNVKLRALYGVESLKLKRLLEHDDHETLQLWMEKAEEDYVFPLSRQTVEEFSRALRVDLPNRTDIVDSGELLDLLGNATAEVRIVTVAKTRQSYVWRSGDLAALVDLAEVSAPEPTVTIGIEDLTGLNEFSSRENVIAGRDTVTAARKAMGLPGDLQTSSYLQMLTAWAGIQQD